MKTISFKIPESEYCGMRQIAAQQGVTVSDLLSAFVADATGSSRSGGSDERVLADEYIERRCFTHVWHSSDPEDMAEQNLRHTRMDRWRDAEQRWMKDEQRTREARTTIA